MKRKKMSDKNYLTPKEITYASVEKAIEKKIDIISEVQTAHKEQSNMAFKNTYAKLNTLRIFII